MSLHVRAQLRQAVAARLTSYQLGNPAAGYVLGNPGAGWALGKSLGTAAGSRVYPARVRPTTDSQLPCVLVFTEDEGAEQYTGRTTARAIDLVVRARLKSAGDPPQDALDAMAAEIEAAIAEDESFDGLVFTLQLQHTHTGQSANSDRQAGDIDLAYSVEIHTDNADPTRPI